MSARSKFYARNGKSIDESTKRGPRVTYEQKKIHANGTINEQARERQVN